MEAKNRKCCADCGSSRLVDRPNADQREQIWEALGDGTPIRLNLRWQMWVWGPAPLYALLICLAVSWFWNWESVTRTHCRNWQFWPSISSIIGNASPQKYIWRIFIALSVVQRFHDGVVYFKLYQQWIEVPKFQLTRYDRAWLHLLQWVLAIFHYVEQMALLTLTYVSSSENYQVHELSFIVFAVASTTHMVSMVLLDYRLNQIRVAHLGKAASPNTPVGRRLAQLVLGFRFKLAAIVATFAALMLAAYFFVRHNAYCEDGMYSIFSLLEWLVVCLNVAFHMFMLFEIHHWNSMTYGVHDRRGHHWKSIE